MYCSKIYRFYAALLDEYGWHVWPHFSIGRSAFQFYVRQFVICFDFPHFSFDSLINLLNVNGSNSSTRRMKGNVLRMYKLFYRYLTFSIRYIRCVHHICGGIQWTVDSGHVCRQFIHSKWKIQNYMCTHRCPQIHVRYAMVDRTVCVRQWWWQP